MSDVTDELLSRLRPQLDDEAETLVEVLNRFAEDVRGALDSNLVGVYLKGSFALGSGDVHADVDFLVATHDALSAAQEIAVRELHRSFPDGSEHWAHVLEGSYASVENLRARANPAERWLYVDNGNREMEWSTHDNTEVFRWVLHNRALAISGVEASTLLNDVPERALRNEAALMATTRARDIADDMDYLKNAWGQPHEVLTRCRLLYTAVNAEVVGKREAATWAKTVVATEWHQLIDQAIADRPDPWVRVHQQGSSERAEQTWRFIEYLAPLIARAASDSS